MARARAAQSDAAPTETAVDAGPAGYTTPQPNGHTVIVLYKDGRHAGIHGLRDAEAGMLLAAVASGADSVHIHGRAFLRLSGVTACFIEGAARVQEPRANAESPDDQLPELDEETRQRLFAEYQARADRQPGMSGTLDLSVASRPKSGAAGRTGDPVADSQEEADRDAGKTVAGDDDGTADRPIIDKSDDEIAEEERQKAAVIIPPA